jgi:hypothetical protein
MPPYQREEKVDEGRVMDEVRVCACLSFSLGRARVRTSDGRVLALCASMPVL